MSKKNEKHNTTNETVDYFRPVPLPITAEECIGLTFNEVVKLHLKYNIAKPEKKKPDLLIEIRLSEATLICRIQGDICTEAYLQTDDMEETNN